MMMNYLAKKTVSLVPLFAFLFPFFVYAATDKTLKDIIGVIIGIINSLFPLIIGLAVLFFIWGVAMSILQGDSEEGRRRGKDIMIWGIIAIFVMVSVWGLVNILLGTFFGGGTGSSYQEFLNSVNFLD